MLRERMIMAKWGFFVVLSLLIFLAGAQPFLPPAESSPTVDYICELGLSFYHMGRYEEALEQFNKALLVDPENQTAKKYIGIIFIKDMPAPEGPSYPYRPQPILSTHTRPYPKAQPLSPQVKLSREETMEDTLKSLGRGDLPLVQKGIPAPEHQEGVLSGEYRLSLGLTSTDVIWKDANADKIGVPREKNWRYLWGDERYNTYDPKIFDRFLLDMQTQFNRPLNAFLEVNMDPWTFIGKNQVTIASTDNKDRVDMDLKYWSNDHRTINEIYRSDQGNIINLSQIKVADGKTTIAQPKGLTSWGKTFNQIQPMKVDRYYFPIRKLWFDYKQEDYALKFFPLSDQYEALTTDDPIKLSNNSVYWEESPWLDKYEPSRVFNPDGGTKPLKKGRWVRNLSFFTKDSSDDYPHRLTFLRGGSLKASNESFSLESTVATPQNLWDDYQHVDSIEQATRLKMPINYDLQLGMISTSKLGVVAGTTEANNQVGGVDLTYKLSPYTSLYTEGAGSYFKVEEINATNTSYSGVAGKLGLNYDASKEPYTSGIYKTEVYLSHMDKNFYPGLSNYRYTRRDEPTFSRHIYFMPMPEENRELVWGDGIDRNRNVVGAGVNLRNWDETFDLDMKYRNVHEGSFQRSKGKYIESAFRAEATYQANPRLTTKLQGYYLNLPKTHKGYDPILYAKTMYSLSDYFSEDDHHPVNDDITDGEDPSVGSWGAGAKYALVRNELDEDIVSVEGVYERTNDPLDFPRSLFNDVYVTTETINGVLYDKVVPFVYDQRFFGLPPYDYYDVAKGKITLTPNQQWEHILGLTYNGNKYATGIDDNINHVRLETTYRPTDKWTFWVKYVYSMLIDVYKQNKFQRDDFFEGHHNFFFSSEYKINKDETFTLMYGEFVGYDDPYEQSNWTLSALDTRHIWRMFYRRKF